jgi:tryptophanase
MRYKSFQFLEKSTIGDNEFRDSLKYAGYSSDQVKSLQDWLYEPVNLKWIRDRENSVEKVAEALKNAGITTKPPEDVVNRWQGKIFS